jgi:rubrerythrin
MYGLIVILERNSGCELRQPALLSRDRHRARSPRAERQSAVDREVHMIDLIAPDDAPSAAAPTAALPVDFLCSVCGYGVAVRRVPPACPMCRSEAWVPTVWRPFATQLEPVDGR